MLVSILFLLLILVLSIGIILHKALDKIDKLEYNEQVYLAFYSSLQSNLENIMSTMRNIDIRGSFESDDEVGAVFDQMKAMISALEVFKLEQAPENDD